MGIKKCRAILAALLVLSLSACTSRPALPSYTPPPEGPLSIIVEVDGIRCCNGVLRLAVYNDEAHWLSDNNLVRGRLGFINAESQIFEVHGLSAGKYAIAVYQDIDKDNKLDRWFGVIPKEPYGFSNNVGQYGPVSYKKASFELAEDKTLTIQLNSW